VDHEREGVRLTGYAGLPTLNPGTSSHQHLFVNGRPVRDRLLQGALRGAYADFLARDRHPVTALYLEVDAHAVDVNVHPAKAEVRFRDPALVRGLLVGGLRHALAGAARTAPGRPLRRRPVGASPSGELGAIRPAPRQRASPPGGWGAGIRARESVATAVLPVWRPCPPAPSLRPGWRIPGALRLAEVPLEAEALDQPLRARPGPGPAPPTSSPRPATGWWRSTSTPPTSAWSTSG
jgi:DNA mismatch repair protein MutL